MYLTILDKIYKNIQKNSYEKLLYFPSKISIETGNICNLHCPLCPTNAENAPKVNKQFMSFEDFKIIFNKIKPFVRTIDLFNWGEPFLNKNIGRMLKYIKENKPSIRVFIDTNLNLIRDEQIDDVVRYGLDVLKVSCDGASQQIYEKYRSGGNIDNVLMNIKKITYKKKQLKTNKPKIIWKYLVFKHNEHEVEKARQMAQSLGIGFEASGMRVDCGREIFEKIEESLKRDKEWLPEAEQYNNYKDLSRVRKFCEKPWKTMAIDSNGDVVPCGAIYECHKYSFGNLLKDDFRDIWNGPEYIAARRIILNKGQDKYTGIICQICKQNGYQFF